MAFESGQLKKATLRVVDGDATPSSLTFMYNPEEFQTAKSSSWNRPTTTSAKSATKPQFAGVGPQTVSMDIFFDAYGDSAGDVTEQVRTLLDWVKPTPSSIAKKLPSPPTLAFEWGSSKALAEFRGYLKSVTASYTMFRPDGTPIRASAKVNLEEIPQDPAGQNPTSGSLESQASVTLRDGDSLQAVAWREYGDAAMWRGLAAYNGLDDPLRVPAGTRLLVPSYSEARRLARGEG